MQVAKKAQRKGVGRKKKRVGYVAPTPCPVTDGDNDVTKLGTGKMADWPPVHQTFKVVSIQCCVLQTCNAIIEVIFFTKHQEKIQNIAI